MYETGFLLLLKYVVYSQFWNMSWNKNSIYALLETKLGKGLLTLQNKIIAIKNEARPIRFRTQYRNNPFDFESTI